ncbi:hypothetical protein PT974_02705 [Cladobotryum mycophilum]|uniref:Uncharacterized protein n=1 Tax=Cladobotryum mycophilum TaxID=491253 RepID=A0ABR0SYT9_9HYPO
MGLWDYPPASWDCPFSAKSSWFCALSSPPGFAPAWFEGRVIVSSLNSERNISFRLDLDPDLSCWADNSYNKSLRNVSLSTTVAVTAYRLDHLVSSTLFPVAPREQHHSMTLAKLSRLRRACRRFVVVPEAAGRNCHSSFLSNSCLTPLATSSLHSSCSLGAASHNNPGILQLANDALDLLDRREVATLTELGYPVRQEEPPLVSAT